MKRFETEEEFRERERERQDIRWKRLTKNGRRPAPLTPSMIKFILVARRPFITNAEISTAMGVKQSAVSVYWGRIRKRTGMKSRKQIVSRRISSIPKRFAGSVEQIDGKSGTFVWKI